MWSDNETDLDLLGIQYLVSAVTDTVQNPDLLPTTVGVFGDWGSGKSSILAMARSDLEADEEVLCLTFNGWLFEGYEDAKAALMGAILDGIQEKRKLGPKAKELMGKLARRVDWFSVMGMVTKHAATFALGDPSLFAAQMVGGLAGQDAGEAVGKVAKDAPGTLKAPKSDDEQEAAARRKGVREYREDFGELLKQTKVRTLVVFIDDLDRCLPDTVIETLEAVRLFLYVKGTAFVICADERLVEHAVERRFPEPLGARSEVAQNYLEKLVQVPIRIPALGPSEVRTYMNLLFGQLRLGERFGDVHGRVFADGQGLPPGTVLDYQWFATNVSELPEALRDDLDLTERIGDHVGEMLSGNPRQVKRFLNTLVLRMQMSERRGVKLKQGILAKLMVLEYKKQETFRQLANLQGGQEGKPSELLLLESRAKSLSDGGGGANPEKRSGKQEPETTESDSSGVSAEFDGWLEDEWMRDWLASEPSLGGEDLRPYFYVSRDRIGVITGPKLQLSPKAREVLEQLLSDSGAQRKAGLQLASPLPPADAGSVLQALIERARRAEDPRGEGAPLNILLEYAAVRSELAVEAVLSLQRIPDSRVGVGTPARLADLMRKVSMADSAGEAQLKTWAASGNTRLATAAANAMKRTKAN